MFLAANIPSIQPRRLPSQSLKDVFNAIVIGKLTYCAPAWHGFCLASNYLQLNSFL